MILGEKGKDKMYEERGAGRRKKGNIEATREGEDNPELDLEDRADI